MCDTGPLPPPLFLKAVLAEAEAEARRAAQCSEAVERATGQQQWWAVMGEGPAPGLQRGVVGSGPQAWA
jgi:hypothetical protein